MTTDAVSVGGIMALVGVLIGWIAKIFIAFLQSKIWKPEKSSGNGNNGHDKITREECNRMHSMLDERLLRGEEHFDKVDKKLDMVVDGMSETKSTMSFILGTLKRKQQ